MILEDILDDEMERVKANFQADLIKVLLEHPFRLKADIASLGEVAPGGVRRGVLQVNHATVVHESSLGLASFLLDGESAASVATWVAAIGGPIATLIGSYPFVKVDVIGRALSSCWLGHSHVHK